MAAAYQCDVSLTDDETFVLNLELLRTDGDPFDVADYAFEYSLQGCGVSQLLDESDGITVDTPTAALVISPGVDFRLAAGSYQHGLRKRDIVSDQVEQIFDGTVTVTEGNF